jgi:hypothetical protein
LDIPCDRTPIEGALGDLQPVRIEALGEGHADLRLFRAKRRIAAEPLRVIAIRREFCYSCCFSFPQQAIEQTCPTTPVP